MINIPKLRFTIERHLFGSHLNFFMWTQDTFNGLRRGVSKPIILEPVDPAARTLEDEPTFRLMPEEAQSLMDELWNIGLRPTEGTGSAGAMAAVQAHLADARHLLFAKEGVVLPEVKK